MRKYYLWAFSDGRRIVITRGETMEQAFSRAAHSPSFPRGVTIWHEPFTPVEGARLYSVNHAEGWLYRKPTWLQKAEMEEAVKKGVKGVIQDIANGARSEPLMYKS